jgi:PAS domain S-box-containing protein
MLLLEGLAPTYAAELERMGHAELKVVEADCDSRYQVMIEALIRWQKLNPLVSDIYTFRRGAQGGWVFLLDAETDYDGDGRHEGEREKRTMPGEPYPEGGDELESAFAGRANFMADPVTDRWGTWVSMQVPMRDASGRVEAVLGVDYSAELWLQDMRQKRWVALLHLTLGGLGLAAAGVVSAMEKAELLARVEAAQRLRTSEARLRAMLDPLPFALWLLDADGACRVFNSRAAETRGVAAGLGLTELKFGEDEQPALLEDCRKAKSGAVVSREISSRRETGRHLFRLVAPVSEGPHRTGLVVVELDDTDRVNAERGRHEADKRLALHVRQTPLAYIEWDAQMKILSWNPGAERVFGYAASEASGRHIVKLLVPAEGARSVQDLMERLLRQDGGRFSTNENVTKDGRLIVCEWHNTPLVDETGRVIAVASHAQDITERVALEERVRQSKRIESIGQLAGGVAHEFNNLLTPMLIQVGHIQAAYATDECLLTMLRPVEDSVLQAAELNQRILAVGRKSSNAPDRLPLNPMVEAAGELLRRTIDRRIEFVVRLGEGLPLGAIARGAITQVVMNLALNARDALLTRLQRGASREWIPRLTIATGQAVIAPSTAPEAMRKARGCLTLTISDNGDGMEEAVRKRAFEPFFTTKPAGHGTGLGLAVVWTVVESLGGLIELRTGPGQGASVTVYLPLAGSDEAEAGREMLRKPDAMPRALVPLRVLLVDDNELVCETFLAVLHQAGHKVVCAANGEEGLECLERGAGVAFDVMLMDLNMPRMSGVELLERIRGRGLVRGILVVSGVVEPEVAERLRELGVRRVLTKPIGMGQLLEAVAEAGRF